MLEQDDPQRLALALEGTRLALWDWDMVSGQTVFNERWAEIIGYRLEELEPTTIDTWISLSHPDDLEASTAAINACIAGEAEFYDAKVRMKHRDGHWVWIHDRGRIVERADDGTPLRMVGTHQDITEQVEREIELQEARVVFDNSLEGIITLDADENITSVNPAFTTITGWAAEQVIGTSMNDIRTHAHDPAESARLRALARSDSGLRVRREFIRPDGTHIPILMSIYRVLDPQGEISGFVAQLVDIRDQLRDEQNRLAHILNTDQPTGLPNRHSFVQRVDTEIRSLRASQRTSALLLLSLDTLDTINDAYGDEARDLLATNIASRLQSRLLPGDYLARTSLNTFGIILSGVVSRAEIESKAQGLLNSLLDSCVLPEVGDVFVTGNIGIVVLPEDARNAEQAIQRATAAAHSARADGSGIIRHHIEDFVTENRERVVRVAQLRQGWLDGEFRLDYQPLHDIRSGSLVGVEALMRWESSVLGPVPPSEFIPLAEDIGLIREFSDWAIREATRQGSIWRGDGLELSVSVNITAHDLMGVELLETVKAALEEWNFPAHLLILELTESSFLHASDDVLELFDRLSDLGVKFAIDDFGTGYSSFAYLRECPLDRIKIDKSFIDDIASLSSARSIAAAIIDLGHHLDLEVLAEGVEAQEQLDVLRDLGCDLYQGFLSSPAISPTELAEFAIGT